MHLSSSRQILFASTLGLLAIMACSAALAEDEVLYKGVPVVSGVYRLTLEEAKQLALANNQSLDLGRLNVLEKTHAAIASTKDRLPKILGNITALHFDQPLGTVVSADRLGRQFGLNVVNQDTAVGTIMAVQPITKLIAVNALVQINRADESIAQAQLDKGTVDLLSGIAQAYQGLLGAQRIQASLELQITALEHLTAARPNPALRIGLLEARQGLVQVKGQVQELSDQFANLLDLPPCTHFELVDPLPPEISIDCADTAGHLAVMRSGEVREAELTILKADAALKIAKMDYLPDVNVFGGYANQQAADYIQPNIGFVGVTASYTLWDWRKRKDVKSQRQTQISLAHRNVQVVRAKVELAARKAYSSFEQARDTYLLAKEMVEARVAAEGGPDPITAKAETAKAQLELMKAEIAYRVSHAQLLGVMGEM